MNLLDCRGHANSKDASAVTAKDFQKIALSLPEAVEGQHFGHADFRVDGKIFATLGAGERRFRRSAAHARTASRDD